MATHQARGPRGGVSPGVQGVLFPATAPAAAGPDLASYHVLLANISASKDSQAMLDELVHQAGRQGMPRSRIVTVFADLGDQDEWPGTRELAAELLCTTQALGEAGRVLRVARCERWTSFTVNAGCWHALPKGRPLYAHAGVGMLTVAVEVGAETSPGCRHGR
jgi:hypothetical protein